MNDFRVTGREVAARAGFLEIDRLTITASTGIEHERHVVRHPGAVVVVPVDGHDALLVRQYRASVDRALLEVPAGKRDVAGEPPEETARRELAEEIGMVPGRLQPIAEFYNTPGFCDEYTYLYAAFDLQSVGRREPQSPEEQAMTIERVPFADVERLIAATRIVDAKTIVGMLLTRSFLQGGYAGLDGGPRSPAP